MLGQSDVSYVDEPKVEEVVSFPTAIGHDRIFFSAPSVQEAFA
jgi:hypothetical protein